MSNLTLITGQWHDNINQVEKVEPILGGSAGNANLATKQLAENILWLREKLEQNKPVKVGDIYTTTLAHASAAAVATHHGYGTWERYAEGRTLVGMSTQTADPDDYKTMGNEFGANTHQLTVDEMPSHKHDLYAMNDDSAGNTGLDGASYLGTKVGSNSMLPTGGDLPHNNIQPSKVVGCWLRTA